jgi:hypothetical protein
MKTFIQWAGEEKKELPLYSKEESSAGKRGGIAYWAYPDAYARGQYPDLYFTPIAADAGIKLGYGKGGKRS